jgi:hypothetical protein
VTPSARLAPVLVALVALGCGASLTPAASPDAAPDAAPADAAPPPDAPPPPPDVAESFPCNLRVPDLQRGADGAWSAWAHADHYGVPLGCGAPNLRDGVARFTPPFAGRWILQATGPELTALSVRTTCEDPSSTLSCRDRAGGLRALSLELRAGEPVIVLAHGCTTAGGTCDWRIDATPAPPAGPSCAGGSACAPTQVCQRLLDDPAEEPLCVAALAPRITAAALEVGLGYSHVAVTVEDDNRDAVDVTVSVLDDGGAEVAVSLAGVLGTHLLTGTGARRTLSSRYAYGGDFGAATQARFVARDASGRTATRVVPITALQPGREGQSCLEGLPCGAGLCCWPHYSVAICARDCSR